MKKIFVLALVLLLSSAALSFANTGAPTSGDAGKTLYGGVGAAPTGSSDGTLIGKLSTGVYVGWASDTLGYILTTQHVDGNRSFGSAHNATAIFRNDAFPMDPSSASPIGAAYFGTGNWTAM